MSIASRVNTEFHDDDFTKGLLLGEATLTENSAGTVIGERPEAARELARLLLIVERAINSRQPDEIKKAINALNLVVELAYLESKEYSGSLEDWRAELCSQIQSDALGQSTEDAEDFGGD